RRRRRTRRSRSPPHPAGCRGSCSEALPTARDEPCAVRSRAYVVSRAMKWSWSIGRLAGVDTQIHASFLLLVAWAAWAAWSGAGTTIAVLWGIAFLVAVFGSVLLHELGHALVA